MSLTTKAPYGADSIERGLDAPRAAIGREIEAVADLSERLIPELGPVRPLLLSCSERIVVTGLGKPGHIAGKIAATLSSTGSSSFYVHPTEALHGDSGALLASEYSLKRAVELSVTASGISVLSRAAAFSAPFLGDVMHSMSGK